MMLESRIPLSSNLNYTSSSNVFRSSNGLKNALEEHEKMI